MSKSFNFQINGNYFHKKRTYYNLHYKHFFVFVDTESKSKQLNDDKEVLSFHFGHAIFWNKLTHTTKRRTYFDPSVFWNDLEQQFNIETRDIILFAHNAYFDFKMLNGFSELMQKREWLLGSMYNKGMVFILHFKKYDKSIRKWLYLSVYSTTNYVKSALKELGKSLNLPKMDINFKTDNIDKLIRYCKRDTQIIYIFMKKLHYWLKSNDLSTLKGTSGSIAFTCYAHKFYNDKKEPIFIHNWIQCQKLERQSYKGGISDNFRVGKYHDLHKLDINSQYPFIMKEKRLPYKLLYWLTESHNNDMFEYDKQYSGIKTVLKKDFGCKKVSRNVHENLFTLYQKSKLKGYGIIANVDIFLPKKYAYILKRFDKTMFFYGKTNITLCEPELDFVEKYGKILRIREIAIYKMRILFAQYVDYFYAIKTYARQNGNKPLEQFAKLMLNTLYGKFAQKQILFEKVDTKFETKNDNFIVKYGSILQAMKDDNDLTFDTFKQLGNIPNVCSVYWLNDALWIEQQLEINNKESFVAISSFITSYARMLLVDYILKAKRKNTYYSDTDSLFVNQKGYNRLLKKHCISDTELGKLKSEGFGVAELFAPKFYYFNDTKKIKGIKQTTSNLVKETKQELEFETFQWSKLKTDLKEGNFNKQYIIKMPKTMKKEYTKGRVLPFGIVEPFNIKELECTV